MNIDIQAGSSPLLILISTFVHVQININLYTAIYLLILTYRLLFMRIPNPRGLCTYNENFKNRIGDIF